MPGRDVRPHRARLRRGRRRRPGLPPVNGASPRPRIPLAPLIIQTEALEPEPGAWLREQGAELVECAPINPRFAELLPEAAALLVRTYTVVDEALLERAPNLRVVARAGVGLDNIDVPACRARGVEVVHTPGANTRAVVEFVLALALDALRPRVFLDTPLDQDAWNRARKELTAPRQLAGSTVGILGLGRVGAGVARAFHALDARVIACDVRAPSELRPEARTLVERGDVAMVDVDTLCAESGVLSLHVDGRASNRHLVGADAFGRFKSDVVLINTSRGFVLDPFACAEFMLAHPGACALLDVHDPEPFTAAHPLLDLPNVHLAPHLASATRPAKTNMSWVVRDLWRVLLGESPEHPAE
ncbi:MAG: 3-phosphoglycerate dehydrogenase [Phycisphaerales bacterium]|nr:MAG: 3-phosphoglycerate dehydrogenase [Phycisphaerales bacterium]